MHCGVLAYVPFSGQYHGCSTGACVMFASILQVSLYVGQCESRMTQKERARERENNFRQTAKAVTWVSKSDHAHFFICHFVGIIRNKRIFTVRLWAPILRKHGQKVSLLHLTKKVQPSSLAAELQYSLVPPALATGLRTHTELPQNGVASHIRSGHVSHNHTIPCSRLQSHAFRLQRAG